MRDLEKDCTRNKHLLIDLIPEEVENHFLEKSRPLIHSEEMEKPSWILEPRGNFTIRWKKRNIIKKEWKNVIGQRLIDNITRNLRISLKVRKTSHEFSYNWAKIFYEIIVVMARS